ncbi:unnamed protein product [Phytomonas sp. EM1]|nr:unnamed protein product [Phytomonas sp. EM1]|eukprot:CCW63642.1 unnamed protein product [Phytomonas sp. isolate EM1]
MSSNDSVITPQKVLSFTSPTDGFLCPITANTYKIEFYRFTIRDMDTNKEIFDVERDPACNEEFTARAAELSPEEADALRTIHYRFSSDFLHLRTVGAKVVFSVSGDEAVPNFRMIERHYFRNTLVKSFDFSFGFCIPHSVNTWESIYDMPKLDPAWQDAMIKSPFETVSDSFYFVGDKLIMHNKAYYAFDGEYVS